MRLMLHVPAWLVAAAATATIFSAPSSTAAAIVPAGATAPVDITLTLPLRATDELESLVAAQSDPTSPLYHHFLTPAQFRAAFAPTKTQWNAAEAVLATAGFRVTAQTAQSIRLRGSAASAQRAFGVHLQARRMPTGAARMVTAERLSLPPALTALGATVVGLHVLPPKHTGARIVARPANRYGNAGSYWFTDLKQAYRYPSFRTGVIGKGVTIGILMDSAVSTADIDTYFQAENFTQYSNGVPLPSIAVEPIQGGAPATSPANPYNPNTDGVEASLDLEQSLGSAPGASAILYDIPDLSDGSLLVGYATIVEENAADVVSTSIATCELSYTAAYNGGLDQTGILRAYHNLFLQGNAQGITFVASAGDGGAKACASTRYANPPHLAGTFVKSVDWPASDPAVTGVGGTNLVTSTPPPAKPLSRTSTYMSENAYGDPQLPYDPDGYGVNVTGGIWGSGSGSSAIFGRPAYQRYVSTRRTMRSVPDVSMHMGGCPGGTSILGGPNATCGFAPPLADGQPRSSVWVYYGPNGLFGLVGTSASAPEFSGLVALAVQRTGHRFGNVNHIMYRLAAAAAQSGRPIFHTNIAGWNGIARTDTGNRVYNPIVGLGTPIAEDTLGMFGLPPATDPQTPGNP